MQILSFLVALRSWGEPEDLALDLGLSITPQHFSFVLSSHNCRDMVVPFWHHVDGRCMLTGAFVASIPLLTLPVVVAVFHHTVESRCNLKAGTTAY